MAVCRKCLNVFLIVLLLISTTALVYVKPVEANALKTGYKMTTDFGKGVYKSINEQKGISLNMNDFFKADGSIDWVEYDKQVDMLSNVFGKGIQDGAKSAVSGAKQELKEVVTGQVLDSTPLKGMPGWAKVVLSTGAFLTGADIAFDIYNHFATGSESNTSGDLEYVNGKLVGLSATGLDLGTWESSERWVSSSGNFVVDIVDTNGYYSIAVTREGMGTGSDSMVDKYNRWFKPTNVVIVEDVNKNAIGVFFMQPGVNDTAYYLSNCSSGPACVTKRDVRFGPSYGYQTYEDVIKTFGASLVNTAVGTVDVPVKKVMIETAPSMQYVPTIPKTANDTKTLIVPVGLTSEEIEEQKVITPNIMSDPESFLEENPDNAPDDTKPPSGGGTGTGTGLGDKDTENLEKKNREWAKLITTKFPFSLPFDFYYVISMVAAEPIPPRFEVNEQLGTMPFKFVIDLSFLDPYMPFFRTFIVLGFLYTLIMITRKLMGGAQ